MAWLPTASPFPAGPVRNGYGSAQARPRIAALVCHTEVHNGWKMLENVGKCWKFHNGWKMLEDVGNSIMVGKYWKFIILNLEVPILSKQRINFSILFPSFQALFWLGRKTPAEPKEPGGQVEVEIWVFHPLGAAKYGCGFCYPVHIRTAGSTIQDPSFPQKNA